MVLTFHLVSLALGLLPRGHVQRQLADALIYHYALQVIVFV
jgi:hypothetical protein